MHDATKQWCSLKHKLAINSFPWQEFSPRLLVNFLTLPDSCEIPFQVFQTRDHLVTCASPDLATLIWYTNLRWRWRRTLWCNHRMLGHCMVERLRRSASCRRHHTNTRSDLLHWVRRVLWRCRCLVSRWRWLLRCLLLLLLLLTRLTVTGHWWRYTTMRCDVNHLWHYICTIHHTFISATISEYYHVAYLWLFSPWQS